MRFSNYDPDDPPVSTHSMESDRHFGRFCFRAMFLLLLQYTTVGIPGSVFDASPVVAVVLVVTFLWALIPFLSGFEHTVAALRR